MKKAVRLIYNLPMNILMITTIVVLIACNSETTTNTSIPSDNKDYSAYNSLDEQAIFFETQMMIALDQLGIELQNLPPVSQDGLRQANRGEDWTWHNPHGYLSDVPAPFQKELEALIRQLDLDFSLSSKVHPIWIAERSHLVPESQAQSITEDVLALVVVKGLFTLDSVSPMADWIATIVVKLDDWTIRAYNVNPKVDTPISNSSDHVEFIPARDWLSAAFSTRRVMADASYAQLLSDDTALALQTYSSIDPGLLDVVGILGDGQVETMSFKTGITQQMIDDCEFCLRSCDFEDQE